MSKQARIRRCNRVGVYCRVSTEDQTLASQKHAINEFLKQHPEYERVKWYEDLGYSGAYTKRPAYQQMLEDAEKGRIGTIIVYKLDRFTRDARTAIWTILRLDEIGCNFIAVTQPMFTTGTIFRHVMIAIFAELAQMERDQIVQRVKAGMAAAKARGAQIGRVPVMTPEMKERAIQLREGGMSYKKIATELNVSVGAIHNCMKETFNKAGMRFLQPKIAKSKTWKEVGDPK